ncbi:MAG: RsmB/NOP family class I SAM-dependent RNA methyltransferase [Pseudomonadota bacterium]
MTPAARVLAAIEVLDQVLSGTAAEQVLTRWARQARYAGSKDRAAVRDHVFQALRCRRSYAVLGGGSDGRAIMIGAIRAKDGDPEALFTGDAHAPAPLSPEERASAGSDLSEADMADLPDWLWSVFVEDLGPRAMDMAMAQKARAPVALRVNIRLNTVMQAIETLSQDGVFAEAVPSCPTALIVREGERKIRNALAYQSGAVELQDVNSQAAMTRVSISPDARVLDYCAGGGGKTLALAAALPTGRSVQFFAHDSDPTRMADLPARSQRAGVDVTRLRTGDVDKFGPFDLVLCDVPCSGSGTWRRTPDAKWRLTPERLQSLEEIQRDILRRARDLLRPGGQLIYTTCSVLRRENAGQMTWFRQEYSKDCLEDEVFWPVSETGDGFFYAALRRGP